jgi:5,10-methylenetetrahydromethanopterin reductase
VNGPGRRFSCAIPPSADAVELARFAEELGYHRVWVFESPAVYGDPWIALARIAEGTTRIGVATGVSIPELRHPMVTASAIATIDQLAPGRLVVALGTGYTGRLTLGQQPVTWARLARYHRQVRGLLDGAVVDVDGHRCQMMHLPGFAPGRPIPVPLWIAASGPRGFGVAREVGAPGVLTTGVPDAGNDGWADLALLRFGTVLDDGEDHTTPRVVEAAGPGYASTVHARWQYAPDSVDAVPGGTRWRVALERERPPAEHHLIAHQGHLQSLTDRDRALATAAGPALLDPGWVGDGASLRDRIRRAAAAGVTEPVYVPAGPDPTRELAAFAAAATHPGTEPT